MKNEKEFKSYLSKYNLSFDEIKKKIEIEAAWNDLIYSKYISKLEIDKIKIKNKINDLLSKNKEQNVYLISEIMFNTDSFEEIQKKYKLIEKSISEVGFKNTANLYSVSASAKLGGQVGWVNETQLSKIIKKEISKLKVGEYTKPITIPGSFLIIHLDDKKIHNIYLNFDEEFEKQIAYERDAQLEQYSKIYFKKIKKNSIISEK
jgi:peptidyl-prolyl cis-trans isomerase SurA